MTEGFLLFSCYGDTLRTEKAGLDMLISISEDISLLKMDTSPVSIRHHVSPASRARMIAFRTACDLHLAEDVGDVVTHCFGTQHQFFRDGRIGVQTYVFFLLRMETYKDTFPDQLVCSECTRRSGVCDVTGVPLSVKAALNHPVNQRHVFFPKKKSWALVYVSWGERYMQLAHTMMSIGPALLATRRTE